MTTRVLDVGCHEGFVGFWLLKQLAEVQIDGIELHAASAAEARRRGYHEVVVGAAEDAYKFFEPGTYDIVFAAEVIEHVPDVDRFLSACEQMLRPGGILICTTPDGTFGTGNNPHHLRALRSIDLAELLRRRGDLHRMTLGRDGLTLGAYRPAPKRGEIAIHTGGAWERWAPQDIQTKGLGGSETAAVKLAHALSELGWIVTVYGDLEQGCHDNVVFRHHETFDPLTPREVLISSRMPELFDRPVNARVKLLWAHDTDFGERLSARRAESIDHVLALSSWHASHLGALYPFLGEKVIQTRNGIELSNFSLNGNAPKRRRRVAYTSSPDRGLDILLELWPQIRKRVKGAELQYAYAPVYFAVAEQDPVVAEHAQRIAKLSDQPGVTALGSLSQPEVAKLLSSSLVWAHPSYNTPHQAPFHETSCIGAMEAQAAGCCVVASNWGALPETVRVGSLIDAEPLSEAWKRCFVEAIVRGLTDHDVQRDAQEKGPEAVKDLSWEGVARMVTEIVEA